MSTWVNSIKILIFSCIPDTKEFHSPETDQPFLYCKLSIPSDEVCKWLIGKIFNVLFQNQRLLCPPAMNYYLLSRNLNDFEVNPNIQKLLIRGDSSGKVAIWRIPDVSSNDINSIKQQSTESLPQMPPVSIQSLEKAWSHMKPSPCGILDQLVCIESHTMF